jgi:subtilase family serine protease
MIYQLTQTEKLDDLYARPDLAISEEDVVITDKTVKITVHNIGSSPANDFMVTIIDNEGKVLTSQSIARLDAPLDLLPRTTTIQLPLKRSASCVLIDPKNHVPEISEENNRLVIQPLSPRKL